MNTANPNRLSQISTNWSEIFTAHSTSLDSARIAHNKLVERYCGAVFQYLLSATNDIHAADDLTQTFALRFVRGDFHRADPTQGRFRDFIKTVLYHLVVDHFRDRKRTPSALPAEDLLPHAKSSVESSNAVFVQHWRQEILNRTWQELKQNGGSDYFAVLQWKAINPEGRSAEGALALSRGLNREITAAGLRQTMHRAREEFAKLLIQEVAYSLGTIDAGSVEQELAELQLMDYCRPVLSRISEFLG